MAVIVDGVPAQVIKTTPAQIIAVTAPIALSSCADASGPIDIFNVDTGDSAAGPAFTYLVAHPVITSVPPAIVTGGRFSVVVANGSGTPRFVLANRVIDDANLAGELALLGADHRRWVIERCRRMLVVLDLHSDDREAVAEVGRIERHHERRCRVTFAAATDRPGWCPGISSCRSVFVPTIGAWRPESCTVTDFDCQSS